MLEYGKFFLIEIGFVVWPLTYTYYVLKSILADEAANRIGDMYIRSVCFSPDGEYLATGAEDKLIRVCILFPRNGTPYVSKAHLHFMFLSFQIWDIRRRKIRTRLAGHPKGIYSLDFSRDGKLIVSGSGDGTARIWNVDTGEHKILNIIEPETVDVGITSVGISPDGRFVATGSLDTIVRIWDMANGTLVERLRGHKDSVYSVAFSPDGRGLVSGSLDKSLKYWDLTELGSGGDRGSPCTTTFTGHKVCSLVVHAWC